jgi:hypothetical protein
MSVVYREGQNIINNTYNPVSLNNIVAGLFSKIKTTEASVVRVKSIILNSQHPRYNELGKENSIGVIIFDNDIEKPNINDDIDNFPYAYPLQSNIKHYPLINELVYIFNFPSKEIGKNTANKQLYYSQVIPIWNNIHHNAYPDNSSALPLSQNKNYAEIEAGSNNILLDTPVEIKLGDTFKEKDNIYPLTPYEGDIIYEGRWGNSIRLGSTVTGTSNTWSNVKTNGDPIIIIRNGQGNQNPTYQHITEDINNDDSSIYLTSTQQIPLTAASINYKSYTSAPTQPDQYSGKQIVLNSGRLVFNSNKDHILLSSNKSINLNAVESINIDTKTTIVDSKSVLLGGKNATESILLGDTTIELLAGLVDQLTALTQALTTVMPDAGPAVSPAALQLIPYLTQLKTQLLNTTRSKISKTL